MKIEAIGQTINQGGDVVLISQSLPANCMVLFVNMETWAEIKDTIEVKNDKLVGKMK